MSTVTVRTKEELERAVKNREEKIIIQGPLASKIIQKNKKKSLAKKIGIGSAIGSAVAVVAGIIAAPVTGGASAVAGLSYATVSYAIATTAGGTAVALSTTEFIAGILGILGALGIAAGIVNIISKNYDVTINANSKSVECTRKS